MTKASSEILPDCPCFDFVFFTVVISFRFIIVKVHGLLFLFLFSAKMFSTCSLLH